MGVVRSINRTFQKRKNIYLYVFIGNAVVYGLFNLLSVLFSKPVAYPLGTIFLWSIIITTFLVFTLNQMFYWNLVPMVLYILLKFALSEQEHAEATHVETGGFELQIYVLLGVLVAFFIIGLIMEIVTRSFGSRKISSEFNDQEEDTELWEEEDENVSTYTDKRYEPIKKDDPRWS